MPLFISTLLIDDSGFFVSKNLRFSTENSSQPTLEQSIWNSIEKSQLDTLELNIEIDGYRVIPTEANPIDLDEKGQLFFVKNNEGFINLELTLGFGDYKFDNIPVRGNLVLESIDNYFVSYNLDDPKKGFFMDIFFFPNSIQLDLAFNDGEYQFCYNGIYNQGYNEITPLYPHTFEPDQALRTSSNSVASDLLLQSQTVNVFISNQKFLENSESKPGTRGVTITKYGVSHEGVDFDVDYPSELPDEYWEPYTAIDIGINRIEPTEAQVKSDLQVYNRDYYNGGANFIFRDILAYVMGSHGGPPWYITAGEATIYSNEIEALWYNYYDPYTGEEINVWPTDTIIMVDACKSYWNASYIPAMAEAFVDVDNGAAAFVGSTLDVPQDSDSYMRAFWGALTIDNTNVEDATIALCEEGEPGWNLGDEWRIYGDEEATLP